MVTKVTYNEETKETTTESILTAEDEPCGTETNYKYEYDLQKNDE
ncbi:hypothetical protein [Oceanobacillus sp. J11TS1]|nr:hypothetical protein [Oceanobacillus sp. J11TS1]GIO25159.1 hypothetical protein J11TS1_37400 [Oceanobacillus sp. J11TS1]